MTRLRVTGPEGQTATVTSEDDAAALACVWLGGPGVRRTDTRAGFELRPHRREAPVVTVEEIRMGPAPSEDPTEPITVRLRKSQIAALGEIADRQDITLRQAIVESAELAIARGSTR